LILTDGAISDFKETKNEIVDLSFLPCSIIIVGIGGANFSEMEALDGDDGVLRNSKGAPAARDTVQFVEFRKASSSGNLAAQVLKEVPEQMVKYMISNQIDATNFD
jgi:copine 1/2/3